MIMKQMPYRIPDGFIEESKAENRAAIRAAANRKVRRGARISKWAASVAATAACLAICAFVYSEFDRSDSEFDKLIAQMESASNEIIYEMSSDALEYPEDINYL